MIVFGQLRMCHERLHICVRHEFLAITACLSLLSRCGHGHILAKTTSSLFLQNCAWIFNIIKFVHTFSTFFMLSQTKKRPWSCSDAPKRAFSIESPNNTSWILDLTRLLVIMQSRTKAFVPLESSAAIRCINEKHVFSCMCVPSETSSIYHKFLAFQATLYSTALLASLTTLVDY